MTGDYGRKIYQAFHALLQLHADTLKLLQDCDGAVGRGRKSVYRNLVFDESSRALYADHWMVEGVFRYWDAEDLAPGLFDGITVCFGDAMKRIDEPLLIAGRLLCKGKPKKWALWNAFLAGPDRHPFRQVVAREDAEDGRIVWLRLIGIPLYSITAVKDVVSYMEQVRVAGPKLSPIPTDKK